MSQRKRGPSFAGLSVNSVLVATAAGGATQDLTANKQFVWDLTNHRLGIGTIAPSVPFHVAANDSYRNLTVGQLFKNGSVFEDGSSNGLFTGWVSSEFQWWMHSGATGFAGTDLSMALDLSGNLRLTKGYLELKEMTAPAVASADTGRIFMVDSGGGKTVLKVQFPSGAAQVLATEP